MPQPPTVQRWQQLLPALAIAVVAAAVAVAVVLSSRSGGPHAHGSPEGSPGAPGTAPTLTAQPPTGHPSRSPGAPGPPQSSVSASGLDPCRTPRRLRVMTFNIHSARTAHGMVLDRVGAEIRAAHPDVVLLQEVDRGMRRTRHVDMPAVLGRATGLHPYFGGNVDRDGGVYGTAVLTRFPAVSTANAHLPNRPGMEQRGLLRVTMLVEGQQLTVYDTHLQQTSGAMRLTQMQAIKTIVSRTTGAVVLGGDLNANPDSPVLGLARTFLDDAWTEVGEGNGYTADERHPGHRIDYVLHNAWLTATSAEVRRSRASDHRSVVVDLDLWPNTACR